MLVNIINKRLRKLKGDNYQLDKRIPNAYLVKVIITRLIMKLRGLASRINYEGIPFIGRGVFINGSSKIKIGKGVSIGNRCLIDALSTDGIIFGNNVSVGRNTIIECTGSLQFLGKGMKVGDNVGLGTNNFYGCAGGIEVGDDTIVGNFVSFHAENHVYSDLTKLIRLQGVIQNGIRVGKNCWIGAKSTILDGAIIEDGCIIAAGAVVGAGIYEKNGIYGGVPAKLIKRRN